MKRGAVTFLFSCCIAHFIISTAVAQKISRYQVSPAEKFLNREERFQTSENFTDEIEINGQRIIYSPHEKQQPLPALTLSDADSAWDNPFGLGIPIIVNAIAVKGNELYVGGIFSTAGGVPASNVAKWDGNNWMPLGSGTNGQVFALTVAGNDIYAGGSFDSAGGVLVNHIARWNGTSWFPVSIGTNGVVNDIIYNGLLYAGGGFTQAGGVDVDGLARWDGASWSAIGSPSPNLVSIVNDLELIGSDLYIAKGVTDFSGLIPTFYHLVGKWNGSTLIGIGYFNDGVTALAAIGSDLYAGGPFSASSKGTPFNHVAKWNGTSWSAVGTNIFDPNFDVQVLATSGPNLYVGGHFSSINGVTCNDIVKWNGTSWSALGSGVRSGVGHTISTIAVHGGNLFVGGVFDSAGEQSVKNIARWKIASTPVWSWASSAGNTGFEYIKGIASDEYGNTYVTGDFTGSVDFGLGPVSSVNSSYDVFIIKYDSDGNTVWVRTAGGTSNDYAGDITMDVSGNLWITGDFYSTTMEFDSVAVPLIGSLNDIFVAKYTTDGNILFASSAGGTGNDYTASLCSDDTGNVYVAGYFYSPTIQFGSTPLLINSSAATDIFIVKYSSAGNVVWSRKPDGISDEMPKHIVADQAGNIYVTGHFYSGFLKFAEGEFGVGEGVTNNGAADMFVVKYNTAGTYLWSQRVGGSNMDYGLCIGVDQAGAVYTGGGFTSTSINFPEGQVLTSNGYGNMFLVKYSSGGGLVWVRQSSAFSDDFAATLIVDQSNNIFLGGSFAGNTLPIGHFSLQNSSYNYYDLYVTKYDSGGTCLWITSSTGDLNEIPRDMAIDPGGNIILAGEYTSTTARFDNNVITGQGNTDGFLAKLGSNSFQFSIEQQVSLQTGWNLLSLPVIPENDSVDVLFPVANSNAFSYSSSGYTAISVMEPGPGYWLKFPSASSATIPGFSINSQVVPVFEGWNIVGSVTEPVPASSITSSPPGLVTSNFFGYTVGYTVSDTIMPGNGYWVKVNGDGELTISSSVLTSAMNRISIQPTSELPPSPPESNESETTNLKPEIFALHQNFPNPFNPRTVIRYQLPVGGKVILQIFNLLGQEVATLVDRMEDAGNKSVVWNAANVPSGVYFYKMSAGPYTATRKMLLLK